MLAAWLDRGLGQMIAPDENHEKQYKEDPANTSFWQMVAPDPIYEASSHGPPKPTTAKQSQLQATAPAVQAPPSSAFLPPTPQMVRCQHCHKMTKVVIPMDSPSTPMTPSPLQAQQKANSATSNNLEESVLKAARGMTESFMSPPHVVDERNKFFRFCASTKPLQEKILKRMEKMLAQNPKHFLQMRASLLGNYTPDGFTPLMACAYVNQVDAARVILEFNASNPQLEINVVTDVDLQGRTALHIAAEMGSLDVVRLLQQPKYTSTGNTIGTPSSTNSKQPAIGKDAPVDLVGLTPLGRAVTSSQKSAQRNRATLTDALFSPGDKSVCGKPTPMTERSRGILIKTSDDAGKAISSTIPVGTAQMPGFRVTMEDALLVSKDENTASLWVGVCDGHGDYAVVSEFVANQIPITYSTQTALSVQERWKQTCLAVDEQVRDKKGGSTGIFGRIDQEQIVIANVGDCRCILVQKQALSAQATPQKDESKEGEAPPALVEEEQKSNKDYLVLPLSQDHKPNLPSERQRVEKAGFKVRAEHFYEEGVKKTIHQIELTEGHHMTVARSFGDFEYKSRTGLGIEEQAVVAVPDVTVHKRTGDDMYLVLACDGIWDVMSNDDVADFVVQQVEKAIADDEPDVLARVGDLLLNSCLEKGSRDNMTVVLVALTEMAAKVSASGSFVRKTLSFA